MRDYQDVAPDWPERGPRFESMGQAAEDAARRAQAELDDARITAEIKAALLATIPVTGLQVDVDTEGGVVYLRGDVASGWQKREAERLARRACPRGMQRLINELRVNPDLPPFQV